MFKHSWLCCAEVCFCVAGTVGGQPCLVWFCVFFWVFFNIQQQIQRLPAVQFIAGQTRNIMTVVIANETWWMAAPEVVKTTQEHFCVCFLTDVFGVLQTRHASLCNVQEMKSCLEPMNNSSCTPLVVPYELFNRFNAHCLWMDFTGRVDLPGLPRILFGCPFRWSAGDYFSQERRGQRGIITGINHASGSDPPSLDPSVNVRTH